MSGDHKTTTSSATAGKNLGKEYHQKAEDALEKFALSGNKLFGVIPVPKDLQGIASMLTPPLVSWATAAASDTTERLLPGTGKVIGYALPVLAYAQPTIADSIKYKKEISAFNAKLQPLFSANKAGKSGMGKLFDSGERPNAIIQFARNQKHGRHMNILFGDVVDGGVKYAYQHVVTNKEYKSKIDGLTHREDLKEHFGGINPQHLLGGLVGGVSNSLKDMVNSKLPEEFKGKCSLDMCYEFAEDMNAAAKSVDPLDKKEFDRELRNQSQKIIAIFKARYKESGWNEMPERVTEKMEDVAEQIARPMLSGELSPMAIINLAGESRIIQNNGHTVASESDVGIILDEQLKKLSTMRVRSIEEFAIDTEIKMSDVASALKTLGNEEKAYLSTVVPRAMLEKNGVSKEQLDIFYAEGKKCFDAYGEVILHELAKRPAEDMREFFSKKEIAFIRELDKALTELDAKPRHREDDLDAMDEKDQILNNKVVKDILAKGYLKADKPGSWAKLVEEKRNGAEHGHKKHAEKGEKSFAEHADREDGKKSFASHAERDEGGHAKH